MATAAYKRMKSQPNFSLPLAIWLNSVLFPFHDRLTYTSVKQLPIQSQAWGATHLLFRRIYWKSLLTRTLDTVARLSLVVVCLCVR